jgi:hypothetical protein
MAELAEALVATNDFRAFQPFEDEKSDPRA